MLDFCKALLKVLCLWPTTVSQSTSLSRYLVKLSIEGVTVVGSFLYAIESLDDMDEATNSGFVCLAFLTTISIYVWLILKKYKIEHSIDQLESYVNERVNRDDSRQQDEVVSSKHLYKVAEHQYTKRARRYIYSWFGIVCFYGIVILTVPIIDMIHGQMNASNWATLFRKKYPIDESKISSFFIHYVLDFATTFIHFTIYSTSCTYHMATAEYVSAMVLDVKLILERCNVIITADYDLRPSDQNVKVNKNLHEAVSLHANIVVLTRSLAKNMSGVLFIIIMNSIVFMAAGLFQMETKTKAGAFEVYVSLNSIMLQTTLIWYFCYHSALVSMRLRQISDFAYAINWYETSNISQKSIMMMIRQSNERFSYSGLGILKCDMQTLSMMVNSVVSYYLLLKKMQ